MSTLSSVNPFTGEKITTFEETSLEQIPHYLQQVRGAQNELETSPNLRIRILENIYHTLSSELDEIALQITKATGRPIAEVYNLEILPIHQLLLKLLKEPEQLLYEEKIPVLFSTTGRAAWTSRKPYKVVAVVTSRSFAFTTGLANTINALAAGCGVILKCSPHMPLVATLIEDIVHKAAQRSSIPKDIFKLIIGGSKHTIATINAHPDSIIFIGSTNVGREIGSYCAKRFIPHVLELSAHNVAILLDDAEVEHALRGIIWGSFFASGQSCANINTVFVPYHLWTDFSKRIPEAVQALRLGDPSMPTTDIGPLSTPEQQNLISENLNGAIQSGDVSLVSKKEITHESYPGTFSEPAVVAAKSASYPFYSKEFGGPILTMVPYRNLDEGIATLNQNPYGMQLSIWTREPKLGFPLAKQAEVGGVYINDVAYGYAAPNLPWGGTKLSGYGTTHPFHNPSPFTRPVFTAVTPFNPRLSEWWFPYQQSQIDAARAIIKAPLYIR